MIKQWNFKNASGKTHTIRLHTDGVWFVETVRCTNKSFEEVWNKKSFGVPVSVMQELYCEMAKENFGGRNRHKRFWQAIRFDALNEFSETVNTNNRRDTVQLTKSGVELTKVVDTKNKSAAPSKTEETLDRIFFFGFEQWGVPLSLRKKTREIILNALSADSGFSLQDAFPLIDYEKIQTESITITTDDSGGMNDGGKFQFLYNDRIEIGGWDRGSGGSKMVSLERFFANECGIQSDAPALFLKRIQEAIDLLRS